MSSKKKIVVDTKACGPLTAYLHGGRVGKDVAALTVHDLGCNHKEFYEFVNHEHMSQLTQRCFWIHVEVPGQGDNMPDLPSDWKFPTMQKISEGISELCDSLELKHVVVIGDGAGANIVARFAIAREDICLGAILIHCTGTTAGFMESLRDRVNAWKLKSIGMNPSVENYLVLHRFGVVCLSGILKKPQQKLNFMEQLKVSCSLFGKILTLKISTNSSRLSWSEQISPKLSET
uniref:Abhydrolase_2 domain-containing protein n=1 Tax=Mesocestoides corti TaxID=53468 RepID=A0A5K3EXC1_MESCO